ncbi:glycosyltransferase [Nostoc sp. 106C]|uniref:glycosyltransferase n=1 Tax=Nostoc sp. 106C TaxID=1932667 RepID=UPI000A3A739B|nr:glycosyltransferase [Nostoc sp. 106C]OUL31384.1 glycosyl transferase family 2 [Nostoc sp. 106C]
MNVVTRIRFPCAPESLSLYLRCSDGAVFNSSQEQAEVAFIQNSILSLNTYFNSFYAKFYAKYTHLNYLYYLLTLEGDFKISLYRESYKKESRELIYTANFDKCLLSEPIKVLLPDSWRSENAGRVYLEITCLSDSGLFLDGYIVTEQPKIREVNLGIITCTFKKEVYVKNTVSKILQDNFLSDKKFKVFVVDNGKTLQKEEFNDSKVQLIPNRNLGGSGGFTRGLIQALQEDSYTHFLLMDDDIELETEAIYKLFSLYEYATQDFAISGSMLDLYKKHILSEAGALYAKSIDSQGNSQHNPFAVICLKHRLNLENTNVTNLLLLEDSPEYGGFWFFSFSKETIQKIGLPMPFFIKIDDMEFGLRITRFLSQSIVAFPGIAVWHEPFYAKNPIWDNYYRFRNHLITNCIYSLSGYIDIIKFLTQQLLYSLLVFDYNSAEMVISGFEDYLKGPQFIINNDPENIHSRVVGLSKSYNTQSLVANFTATNKPVCNSSNINILQTGVFRKIIALVTINGHLLPDFLLSNDEGCYSIGSESADYWYKEFAKKRVVIVREGNNSVYLYEMNRTICIKILMRWFKIITKSTLRWNCVTSEWKNAFKYLTSSEFWKDYLNLNEQTQKSIHKSLVN